MRMGGPAAKAAGPPIAASGGFATRGPAGGARQASNTPVMTSTEPAGGRRAPQRKDLLDLRDAALTYAEVGASLSELPDGYRHLRVSRALGRGEDTFERAAQRLLTWQLHESAGIRVQVTDTTARVGAVCRLGIGVGPLRLWAPCRVVAVVDEPRAQGFAYGTLPGHPEQGEEFFLLERDADDRVILRLYAFSRPGTWWTAFARPLSEQVQEIVTARYLHALIDRS